MHNIYQAEPSSLFQPMQLDCAGPIRGSGMVKPMLLIWAGMEKQVLDIQTHPPSQRSISELELVICSLCAEQGMYYPKPPSLSSGWLDPARLVKVPVLLSQMLVICQPQRNWGTECTDQFSTGGSQELGFFIHSLYAKQR